MKPRKYHRNVDFWIALGMNSLFLITYICFFHITLESNDDRGMAFLVEGAYGTSSSHLVFENLLWGKFLTILYALIPNVSWYFVVQYFFIFVAYTCISYVILKMQGKTTGIISITLLLSVFGYQTYVIFQWTRTAGILTVIGIVLLFYGLDSNTKKKEKIMWLLFGITFCVFGSMIRFLYFVVCVFLTGGIGLYKLLFFCNKKTSVSLFRVITYIGIFVSVGLLCTGLYVMDRQIYQKDAYWGYYSEYNKLRSELWDYGFPKQNENKELYEELEITSNDLKFYRNWNMDEELLPLKSLQKLVAAKPEKQLSWEIVKGFLKVCPKHFFLYSVFGIYVLVSTIAILLDKKNILIVIYEFIGIMALEFYFYYTGRFGLPRVETGLWLSAIVSVLYVMSEKITLTLFGKKYAIAGSIVVLSISLPIFGENIANGKADIQVTKNFHQMMSKDKKNLYLVPVKTQIYKMLDNAYELWEPSHKGDASNIYHLGGWEFNIPVKKSILTNYGVDNVYRDCVDHSNMIIVVNSEGELLEQYVQENYNVKAKMYRLKNIDGILLWRMASKNRIPQGKLQNDLSKIKSDIQIKKKKRKLHISGYAFKENTDSFQQYIYLKMKNLRNGEISYSELMMTNLKGNMDLMNGKYSAISGGAEIDPSSEYQYSLILQTGDELYEIAL